MSQELFCDSPLLTSVSCIIYVSPYIYVSNYASSTIIRIDSAGNATLLATITAVNLNFMVYVNGYIYVTGANPYIYKVNINDGTWILFASLPDTIPSFPAFTQGITYSNGLLYVSDGYNKIYSITLGNTPVVTLFIASTISQDTPNTPQIVGIATDLNNNFYLNYTIQAQPIIGDVAKYNSLGSLLNEDFISNVEYRDIIFYKNNFYFTNGLNPLNDNISKYNINGTLINGNYATGRRSTDGTSGIAFDTQGNFMLLIKHQLHKQLLIL